MQFSHRIASIDNVQSAPSPPPLSFCLSLYHPIRCSSSSAVGNASFAAATGAINVGNALSNAFYFLFTLPPTATATSPPESSTSPSLPHAYITRCPTQRRLSPPLLPFPLPAQLMPHFTSDADCVQMIAKYGNNLYAVLPPDTPMCPHTQRVATLEHPTICYLPLYGLLLIIIKELGGWMRRPNEPEEVRK